MRFIFFLFLVLMWLFILLCAGALMIVTIVIIFVVRDTLDDIESHFKLRSKIQHILKNIKRYGK